jgi:hypothetical protein
MYSHLNYLQINALQTNKTSKKAPGRLHCRPTCAKFSWNHIHSLMNPVPTLEEEEEEEEEKKPPNI